MGIALCIYSPVCMDILTCNDRILFSLQLAWTCYNFYQSTPTKLAGENYFFHPGQVSHYCIYDVQSEN